MGIWFKFKTCCVFDGTVIFKNQIFAFLLFSNSSYEYDGSKRLIFAIVQLVKSFSKDYSFDRKSMNNDLYKIWSLLSLI